MNFEIDFNDFFNRDYSSAAVTCITDDTMISRICYDNQYHADVLATMLTFLTNEPYTIKQIQYANEEDLFFTFIRYVIDKDSIGITIELPHELTDNIVSSLESLMNSWKSTEIKDKEKIVDIFLMDEEFNKKYNPNLDGLDFSKIDLMVNYLKEKVNNRKK